MLGVLMAAALAAQSPCAFEGEARDWASRALSDWARLEQRHIAPANPITPDIILFDEHCVYELDAAADGNFIAGPRRYTASARAHGGRIAFPNGQVIEPDLISFAWGNDDGVFFVMALPSIWRAKKPAGQGDTIAMFVFMHEFAHTQQVVPMGRQFQELGERGLPNGSNDDSIQDIFGIRPGYQAAYERERDAFYVAASAPDAQAVRTRLGEALRMVRDRQTTWFRDAEAVYAPAEDLFLTLEASGNWMGLMWLLDPEGGAMSRTEAVEFARGPRTSWSQDEGLGIALTLDRVSPGWVRHAFGERLTSIVGLAEQAAGAASAP